MSMIYCFFGLLLFPLGPALCLPADCYALLHLCHHWDAGGWRYSYSTYDNNGTNSFPSLCLCCRCLATSSWMRTQLSITTTTSALSSKLSCCCSGKRRHILYISWACNIRHFDQIQTLYLQRIITWTSKRWMEGPVGKKQIIERH